MKDLIISAPNQGIAQSPHVGFGDIRNLDISSIPGVAQLNTLTTKVSGSTVTALPLWIKKNPLSSSELFALDIAGTVYTSTDSGGSWSVIAGNTTTGAHGEGMEIWKDYLFVARSAYLDVYGPLSGARAWSNGWQSLTTDSDWHPMVTSFNDGSLYVGAGRDIVSVEELTTFLPGTGSTYTFSSTALTGRLGSNYKVRSLCELGSYLMIGTWQGASKTDFKVADIFPWDRDSTFADSPIRLNENGVGAMINVGNILYVFAGLEGKIYQCNGSSAQLMAQIPASITSLQSGSIVDVYPGAVTLHKSKVYFGFSNGASAAGAGMGVWSIQQTSKGSILNYEQTISTGNSGASNKMYIGAVNSTSNNILVIGWQDNTTTGIDRTSTNYYRYTSYGAYFETPFYAVGTPLAKRMFTKGEFQLAAALTTGQGIKIEYRTDISSSYTTIGTYDFSTLAGVLSHNFVADIPKCEFVQFKVSLTTGASSATTPQFKTLTLR